MAAESTEGKGKGVLDKLADAVGIDVEEKEPEDTRERLEFRCETIAEALKELENDEQIVVGLDIGDHNERLRLRRKLVAAEKHVNEATEGLRKVLSEARRHLAKAEEMQREGRGTVLDQFGNPDNPRAHYEGTAPEIWRDTKSSLTHFVATMGTTGTIMGCSAYFREHAPDVQVVGVQPDGDSSIPGIRKWPEAYLPGIFRAEAVDRIIECGAGPAEDTMRELARREGIFCGPSSGGSVWAALQLCAELENATIAAIICDRGDRYISTGVFPS